jgi:hypothetical protein
MHPRQARRPDFNSGSPTTNVSWWAGFLKLRTPPSGLAWKSADHLEVLREMVRAGAGAEPTGYVFTVATMWLRKAYKAQRVSAL